MINRRETFHSEYGFDIHLIHDPTKPCGKIPAITTGWRGPYYANPDRGWILHPNDEVLSSLQHALDTDQPISSTDRKKLLQEYDCNAWLDGPFDKGFPRTYAVSGSYHDREYLLGTERVGDKDRNLWQEWGRLIAVENGQLTLFSKTSQGITLLEQIHKDTAQYGNIESFERFVPRRIRMQRLPHGSLNPQAQMRYATERVIAAEWENLHPLSDIGYILVGTNAIKDYSHILEEIYGKMNIFEPFETIGLDPNGKVLKDIYVSPFSFSMEAYINNAKKIITTALALLTTTHISKITLENRVQVSQLPIRYAHTVYKYGTDSIKKNFL